MQTLRFLLILVLAFSPDSFGNGQTQPKRRYTRPGGRGLRPTGYRPREEATDYCDEVFDCLKKGVCKANPAKPCHCQFNECKTKLDKVVEIIRKEIPNTKDSCKGVGDCYTKKICHPFQACNCFFNKCEAKKPEGSCNKVDDCYKQKPSALPCRPHQACHCYKNKCENRGDEDNCETDKVGFEPPPLNICVRDS